MPRISKIKYDPSLSIKENAEKNKVSEDGIRYYLKTHGIDREGERQAQIISAIRAAKMNNPNASKTTLAREAGVGINTFNKYLPVAEGKSKVVESKRKRRAIKTLVWGDDIPAVKYDEEHGLMSKRLSSLPEFFRRADEEDVSGLRKFLLTNPDKPMLFVGNGGMLDHLGPLLYEMNCGISKAITPLELASMSDATIQNSRFLLTSKSGGNKDIKYASGRLIRINPKNTACYTNSISDEQPVAPIQYFPFVKIGDVGKPFIDVESKFYRYAILYRAFTDKKMSDIDVGLSAEKCYQYQLNNSTARITPLNRIKHFVVLYSDFGAPAAHDFESVLAETGVASATLSDYRNYCHGRYIFVSNRTRHSKPRHTMSESDVAVVLFITPRNKSLVESVRELAIAKDTPVVLIESEYDDSRAAMDMLIKANVFLADYEEKGLGVNPCNPMNYSSIDKRGPKGGVKFAQELNQSGEMTLGLFQPSEIADDPVSSQTPSKKTMELKAKIDALIEQEHITTEALKENPSYLPVPKKSELRNEEHYDMTKHYCVAFRRGKDFWKELPIPLGNMNGGYAYEMQGISFPTSEQSYIFGVFSNNSEKHKSIQCEVLASKSGYDAKRVVRRAHKLDQRLDWGSFNLDWMLYCVWQKVLKNEEFRNILMAIPEETTIIEDTSFKEPDKFWGCVNNEKKEFGKLAKKYTKSLNIKTKAARERLENELLWDYCNVGVYEGKNVMGKILTIIKDCLHKGTEPDIDYELLNRKEIYLLGEKVSFD